MTTASTFAFLAPLCLAGCGRSSISHDIRPDSGANSAAVRESSPPADAVQARTAGDGGPVRDATADGSRPDTRPANQTLYVVTAKLTLYGHDPRTRTPPLTHQFSLLVDWAESMAMASSGGITSKVRLVGQDGWWRSQNSFEFRLSDAFPSASDPASVQYDIITIRPNANGCTGSGSGNYDWGEHDLAFTSLFLAELVCTVVPED